MNRYKSREEGNDNVDDRILSLNCIIRRKALARRDLSTVFRRRRRERNEAPENPPLGFFLYDSVTLRALSNVMPEGLARKEGRNERQNQRRE